ncbi:hypothetical protein KKC63_01715 [Patescibacteria group bacterium]|nr:hypothetical protein [Patescibacteria group bacterium]MBU4023455.1 hypothetical protein [Patescibacteria group bacterium]MBU4078047.1 hypothetical protein [Patescibacteria group bacterium]
MFLKKFLIFIFCFISVFCIANKVLADHQEPIDVNFFYSKTCPHCIDENAFLEKMEEKYCQLDINRYLVSEDDNWEILQSFYQEYSVPEKIDGIKVYGAVPITFIKDKYFLGYSGDERTGMEIENYIKVLTGEICATSTPVATSTESDSATFFGWKISFADTSPLLLAIILGILDGFNACAMVALAFLLTMLIATGMRKRVVIVGGTFILVSGIVYFLFTSAWLNLFLISRNLDVITTIAGIVVIIFAIVLLREYILGIVCKICGIDTGKDSIATKTQKGLFLKLKEITKKDIALPLLILGVAVIAVAINSIELVCSFGFPLVFTRILTSLGLSTFSYYFYIFVFIFFYMLDDFIIFLLAVFTLRITGISEKYLKIVKLISAIVLLILGLIMLIRPELLFYYFKI